MKVNEKKLLFDCISRGIDYGFIDAFRSNDKPTELEYKVSVLKEITKEIEKYFQFDSIESLRDKYPANVEGSKEFNESNKMSIDGDSKFLPKVDRRISGC